ncbi:MAG: histidine--tRNA ligase [Candidatus Heimdallarchaeota archaeon]
MAEKEQRKTITIGRPAGFRDFYPEKYAKVQFILETMRRISKEFGYVEYVTPSVELQALYELKSGEGLVGETFKVQSRSKQKLVLIPELTPSLTRLLAERQQNYTKPIRWFSIPKCFRDETLQRGRVKEFWQYNIDLLGVEDIYADAEIITILIRIITACGLTKDQFVVRVNDRQFMQEALELLGVKNFLETIRVFDRKGKLFQEQLEKELRKEFSKEEAAKVALKIRQVKLNKKYPLKELPSSPLVQKLLETAEQLERTAFLTALQALGVTDAQAETLYALSEIRDTPTKFIARVEKLMSNNDVKTLLEPLATLAKLLGDFSVLDFVEYDGSLVRGLDYYTGIIFEAWSKDSILPRAIAGGGRYADLVATLGGQPLPGTGFGFGETVLLELLEEFNIPTSKPTTADVYIAPIKLADVKPAISLSNKLRGKGIKTILNPFNWRIKRHFENAESHGIEWMIIVGEKDLAQQAVTLRNIVTGKQEIIPLTSIVKTVAKRLKKN